MLLKELVEEGAISEARIDLSVRRILTLKERLGLLDEGGEALPATLTEKERLALEVAPAQAALECITLLKNENDVLPIANSANIFVSGPTANSLNALNGGWSGTWQGKDPKYNNPGRKTAVEALREEFGAGRIQFEELESCSALSASSQALSLIHI